MIPTTVENEIVCNVLNKQINSEEINLNFDHPSRKLQLTF